jgi:hypothetical protein
MKKYPFLFLVSSLSLLFSCADQSADSTAIDKDTASRTAPADTRTTPPATPAQEYAAPPSKASADDAVKDTPRTSISIGKDGASVKTKKGTGVSYDKKGIKVDGKDVKIDIKRDSL